MFESSRSAVCGSQASSALALLARARFTWAEALQERQPADAFARAHRAALQAAAAVLADGASPAIRRRPTSAWVLLDKVAPELRDWSAYFADAADRRAAVEAGVRRVVGQRDADDMTRTASEFISLVERRLGMLPLPAAG